MGLIVQKYGGSSVADVEKIRTVARRVIDTKAAGNDIVAIVSAMGKTTDNLIALAKQVVDNPPDREMDMLLATGEQQSIALLAMAIQSMGHGAVSFTGPQVGILTDGSFSRSRIKAVKEDRIRAELDKGNAVIVAGFQGASIDGQITTLGRGGSDTTAVAVAAALGAEMCDIFTDVDGVYTADPRVVPDARRLKAIAYEEMVELASLGAKVLHSRAVVLAWKYQTPLRVRSTFKQDEGTLVVNDTQALDMERFVVSGVAVDKNQAKISLIGVPDKPGVAATIFGILGKAGIVIDMIIQNVSRDGRSDISFTVPRTDLHKTMAASAEICQETGTEEALSDENIAKVSIVGIGMQSHSGVASQMFEALANQNINIQMISTTEIKVSCVIELDRADDAARALHHQYGLSGNS
ncbi:MAG: aspartate kinase [Candidatus Poribacteria bacterium]|nr:aspartate kinase [Candidatus Poribacteria bacterium]